MATTGDLTVRGVRIAYDRAGQGPPLVLMHGIGANASAWRTQLDGLSDAFDVIAWDAPGYGRSSDPPHDWPMAEYADCLAGFLDVLGIAQAHLLGQSWGGVLAQEFYRHHADRVTSLIALGHDARRRCDARRWRNATSGTAARAGNDDARRIRPRPRAAIARPQSIRRHAPRSGSDGRANPSGRIP